MGVIARANLKTKITFFIGLILLMVIGLSTFLINSDVVPRLRGALLMSSRLVGENLISEVKKTVDLGIDLEDLDGLSDNLEELSIRHGNIAYLYITDSKRQMLYQSGVLPQGLLEASPEVIESGGEQQVSTAALRADGELFYDADMPIVSAGAVVGYLHVGLRGEVITSQVEALTTRMLAIGLVSIVLSTILILLFVNHFVSKPLFSLSGAAQDISDGQLRTPARIDRHDEIGKLSDAFGLMVQGLVGMVTRVRETSSSLQNSAVELSNVSRSLSDSFGQQLGTLDGVADSIGEMDRLSQDLSQQAQSLATSAEESSASIMESTATIGEIKQNMGEINTAIEDISSAIHQTSATVSEMAANAKNTAAMAEETKDSIEKIDSGIRNMEEMADKSRVLSENLKVNAADIGATAVKETLKGILSIQEDVNHAERAMSDLNERVQNIGEIINVIDEIADQTNLLSLNAAIISAQAGEEGRSFAVVASEIRNLSASTTESTKKISSLIAGVQEQADNYSGYLRRVGDSVKTGLKLGEEAEKALGQITSSAEESSTMSNLMAQVTKEQAEASVKVSDSVRVFTAAAEEIRKATLEEAKGAEFIRESMEKAKDMIEKVYRATEEQDRSSRMITETSEKAREVSGELSSATVTEKELAGNIAKAVDVLKGLSNDNFRLIQSINDSAQMLTDLAYSLKIELERFQTEERSGSTAGDSESDLPLIESH